MPPGGIIPGIGHQVPSVLSPPIRITGDWPGASPLSSATSTGSIVSGSRPVYWWSARYSNDTPTKPGGIACPVGVADTLAESVSAA